MKRNYKSNDVPFYLAIHEAGHAVAHWFSGTYFYSVLVRPRRLWGKPFLDRKGRTVSCGGMVDCGRRFNPLPGMDSLANDPLYPLAEAKREAEIEIFLDLAGPIAEAKWRRAGRAFVIISAGLEDLENVKRIARAFTCWNADEMEANAERRAVLLFRNRKLWQATLAVAKTLQTKLSMTYESVSRIIKQHTGENRRPFAYLKGKADW